MGFDFVEEAFQARQREFEALVRRVANEKTILHAHAVREVLVEIGEAVRRLDGAESGVVGHVEESVD